MNTWADRRVVVTGGSRGIGLAVAEEFRRRNARVAICARDAGGLERARAALGGTGSGDVLAAVCDVSRRPEVARFFDRVEAEFGGFDVLVHNAGIGRFGALGALTEDAWREVVEVDLTGSFHVLQEGVRRLGGNPGMPKGWILTIGSLSYRMYVPGNAAYASAKAAQKTLADHLFEEYREEGILGTFLAVGSVNTGFSTRTPDTGWKMQPGEIAEAAGKLAELAFTSPNLCVSYAELRVRRPLPPGRKE